MRGGVEEKKLEYERSKKDWKGSCLGSGRGYHSTCKACESCLQLKLAVGELWAAWGTGGEVG